MRLSALAQVLGLDASTVSRQPASSRTRGCSSAPPTPTTAAPAGSRSPSTASACLARAFESRRRHVITDALEGWTDEERDALRASSCSTGSSTTLMTQHDAAARTTAGDLRMTPDSNGYLSHKQILVVMGGLMTGMFLAALDQSIVGTALPRITSELGGLDKLSWVVTAYLLTATASTPLWGKISDLYGRRLLFQIAIVTFLVGSLLAGFSQNIEQLIAFRAVQGLGGGGLMALALADHRRHHPAARARSLPGLLRRGLRHVAACSARCSAASSPTAPAGSGSSSSTSRSAWSRW